MLWSPCAGIRRRRMSRERRSDGGKIKSSLFLQLLAEICLDLAQAEDLQNQALNINSHRVITMCEVLERRIVTKDLPYDLDEPGGEKEITKGLMRLSQQALSKYVADEPDIY